MPIRDEEFELHGHAAVNLIVARAAPVLSRLWDGGNDNVAFIMERDGRSRPASCRGKMAASSCATAP